MHVWVGLCRTDMDCWTLPSVILPSPTLPSPALPRTMSYGHGLSDYAARTWTVGLCRTDMDCWTMPHGHGLLDSPLTHSPVTRSPLTRSPLTHSPLTHSPLTHSGLTGEPHSLTLPSIHRCTSLERLDIGGCQRVRGEAVSAVMAACLSLTDLDVTQVGRLGFHSLAQMSVTDSDVARQLGCRSSTRMSLTDLDMTQVRLRTHRCQIRLKSH